MVPSGTVVSTIELLIRQCGFTKSRKVLSKSGFGYTINCMASFISELSFVLKGKFSTTEIKHLLSHCLHIITSYCLTVCILSLPIVSLSAHYHLLLSHCLHIITSSCLTVCKLSPPVVSLSVYYHLLLPHCLHIITSLLISVSNHSPFSSRCSPVSYRYCQHFASANKGVVWRTVSCRQPHSDVLSAVDSHTVTYCQL